MLKKKSAAVRLALMFAIGLTILVGGYSYAASCTAADSGWAQLPSILSRIVPPTFRCEDFVITRYGAVGDGVTDCNPAFKKAIAACTRAGGGRVLVPGGIWLTNGPIHLENNVNLHITKNAVVKFGNKFDYYLPLVKSRCEGSVCMTYSPLIYAYKKTNVAVTGLGTFDGQAKDAWAKWGDSKTKSGTPSNENLREVAARTGKDFVPEEKREY
jgi:polygalacturonase